MKEAEFLAKNGAILTITDLAPEKDLKKELKVLKKHKNIKYTLGGHKISDFKNRDIVFYANGIPLKNKFIEYSKKNSKITTKSVAYLFYILQKEFGDRIKKIGVTGTKGKSTISEMAVFLIKTFLENKENKVFKAGNIRGTSNLPILEKIKEGDFLVAELDSWLLQGFGDLKISPDISIFSNFFIDHQNYYHSMKKYFKDKSFIFKFQEKENFLISSLSGKKDIKKYFDLEKIKSKKFFTNYKKNPDFKYTLIGEHNQKNISNILALAKILGIPKKIQKKAMENFCPPEGRMQFLGKKKNILFYNDNNSTTPESTILNLKSLAKKFPEKKIYLLAGGAFKEGDFLKFSKYIKKNIFFTNFFKGEGSDKIIENFNKRFSEFEVFGSMEKSFEKMIEVIKKNKKQKNAILILSPGTSSFGIFKNEYDRNDRFLKCFENF